MKSEKNYLKGDLFSHNPPQKGERGYLEPGFRLDKTGNIVDDKGNIYDEDYNLVKEAPSEGLLIARKQFPNLSDDKLSSMAKIYNRAIENKKNSSKERQP